jgi:hypothetical protein
MMNHYQMSVRTSVTSHLTVGFPGMAAPDCAKPSMIGKGVALPRREVAKNSLSALRMTKMTHAKIVENPKTSVSHIVAAGHSASLVNVPPER